MKALTVVTCPHSSELGGSQIIAQQLAGQLLQQGHRVCIYSPPGPLWSLAEEMGLELVASAQPGGRLWRQGLRTLVRNYGADVVHSYESAPTLGAAFSGVEGQGRGGNEGRTGGDARGAAQVVATVYSMDVPRFIPRHVPLIVGTGRLQEQALRYRSGVHLLAVPVDLEAGAPGAVSVPRRHRSTALTLALVGRLTHELGKAEGVLDAIEAVRVLSARMPIRLLVAGSGDAEPRIAAAAATANLTAGHGTVEFLGQVLDPRWVYEAADIVLGMGSSAVRGMACARPVVVQGERGFWAALTPASAAHFRAEGFFGEGDTLGAPLRDRLGDGDGDGTRTGSRTGAARLLQELEPWLTNPAARALAGRQSRELAEREHGLVQAALALERIYCQAIAAPPNPATRRRSLTRSALGFARFRSDGVLGQGTPPAASPAGTVTTP